MKKIFPILFGSAILFTTSACTMLRVMHDSMSDMKIQKRQLSNGRIIYVDYNDAPAADWKCKLVKTRKFNWQHIKIQSFSQGKIPMTMLMDKTLSDANHSALEFNFINVSTPAVNHLNRHSDLKHAHADFFNCEKINPKHG